MKPQTEKVAKAVGAVIAGATVGYVAGTLTAPASGKETRRRIVRRVEDETHRVAGKARQSVAAARDEAKGLARKASRSLAKVKDRVAEKIHS